MQEITLEELTQETQRAEAERIADQQKFNRKLPRSRNLPEIKYVFTVPENDSSSAILTCQNTREYQEDRGDTLLFTLAPALSLIDRALILKNTVTVLSHCLKDEKAGSTLVLNLSWQDETDTHILAANLGDSRSIVCNLSKQTATRLTCDHTLLRENERSNVISRGYDIAKKYNDMIITARKTNEVVGVQMRSYLHPAGEGMPGLQMTRSLGDHPLHSQSEVFNRTPALSYIRVPRAERCYLLSSSDGITDFVSDEEMRKKLERYKDRSYETRLLRIAQTAIALGSRDNVTCVMTPLNQELPADTIRLQYVADGHSGKASAEFVHHNINKCFILATRLRVEYLKQKSELMPRELRYLEHFLRGTESGLLSFNEGMEYFNTFRNFEKFCKRFIEFSPKNPLYDQIPHSVMNDKEIKEAFDRFKSGEITAVEAMFLFLKRLATVQVPDDHKEFLFYYRKKGIVLCDPTAPDFFKGIDDFASICRGISAMMSIVTERLDQQNAKIANLLKKK